METTSTLSDQSISDVALAQPISRAQRIQTIDMIRGFALLGILMMNIPYFGAPTTQIPVWFKLPTDSIDFQTFQLVSVVFEGTMRALFSMLFGAGALLFLAKKELPDSRYSVADFYYRRLLWLVGFGLVNAYILLWPGDILYTYGICGLVLFPFRKLSAKTLLFIGIGCLVVLFGKSIWKGLDTLDTRAKYQQAIQVEKQKKPLSEELQKAKESWQRIEKSTQYDKKKEEAVVKKMDQGYSTIFAKYIPLNTKLESIKFYQDYFFDALALMFLGMALFKWGFFSNQLQTQTYVLTLVVGYGLGLLIGWLAFQNSVAWFQNPGKALDSGDFPFGWLYHFRRAATAIGHASLLLLLYRSGIVNWLMKALSNVGQMAFSNYLMQSIFCGFIFYGYGFSYFGELALHQLYYVVAGIWLFQLIFSAIWLSYFRFGPFEWLWRTLTYWKKQPMKA